MGRLFWVQEVTGSIPVSPTGIVYPTAGRNDRSSPPGRGYCPTQGFKGNPARFVTVEGDGLDARAPVRRCPGFLHGV